MNVETMTEKQAATLSTVLVDYVQTSSFLLLSSPAVFLLSVLPFQCLLRVEWEGLVSMVFQTEKIRCSKCENSLFIFWALIYSAGSELHHSL